MWQGSMVSLVFIKETSMDLAQEWRVLSTERRAPDLPQHWDERAEAIGAKDAPSDYVEQCIEKMDLQLGDSIFDMGCGSGSIAIPLAEHFHKVLAADFSEGMLSALQKRIPQNCEKRIELKKLAWSDDWLRAGIKPESYDIALASRSLITSDLEEALKKLNEVARRRVCLTVTTGMSPRLDGRMLADIGITPQKRNDAIYAFGIAADLGYFPQVSYITSYKTEVFESKDSALKKYQDMLKIAHATLTQEEHKRAEQAIDTWVTQHLKKVEGGWEFDEPRKIIWAFIFWDKPGVEPVESNHSSHSHHHHNHAGHGHHHHHH